MFDENMRQRIHGIAIWTSTSNDTFENIVGMGWGTGNVKDQPHRCTYR